MPGWEKKHRDKHSRGFIYGCLAYQETTNLLRKYAIPALMTFNLQEGEGGVVGMACERHALKDL